jgi:phosphohistidine phosphatase
MKILYLVRHAKAVERDAGYPDLERELIKRGQKDARQVAEHLASRGAAPGVIISSPAVRAVATARIFGKQFNYPSKRIRTRKAIYNQPASALLDILQTPEEECDQVMLVGHDPQVTDLARFLAPDFHRDIPTSALLQIEFQIERWAELTAGSGRVTMFHFPGAPDDPFEVKAYVKEIEHSLKRAVMDVLREADLVTAVKMEKQVVKTVRELARKFAARVRARAARKAEAGEKK